MSQCNGAIGHNYVGYACRWVLGKLFTHYGSCTCLGYLVKKLVGIDCHAAHCHKEASLFHGAGVAGDIGDGLLHFAHHLLHFDIFK